MRFANQTHVYKTFLDILHTYHKEQRTITDVYDQVMKLFEGHSDLLDEFTQFLPNSTPLPAILSEQLPLAGRSGQSGIGVRKSKELRSISRKDKFRKAKRVKTSIKGGGGVKLKEELDEDEFFFRLQSHGVFLNSLQKRLDDSATLEEILKLFYLFNIGVLSRSELSVQLKRALLSFPDIYSDMLDLLGSDEPSAFDSSQYNCNDNQITPVSLYIGPSYTIHQLGYQPPKCSGRTSICDEVLNDTWESFPTGSEESGFKTARKNQYEEELFRCEDMRCELDVALGRARSVFLVLERLLYRLKKQKKKPVRIEEGDLQFLHVRLIEQLYGERGSEILRAIHMSPLVVIPVVLKRLKQKDLEFKKLKLEVQHMWREANEKDYLKSIDRRTKYFKQNELKLFNTTALLADILFRANDPFFQFGRNSSMPQISFEFRDIETVARAIDFILIYSRHIFTKEDSREIGEFFENVVSPFLSLSHNVAPEEKEQFCFEQSENDKRKVFIDSNVEDDSLNENGNIHLDKMQDGSFEEPGSLHVFSPRSSIFVDSTLFQSNKIEISSLNTAEKKEVEGSGKERGGQNDGLAGCEASGSESHSQVSCLCDDECSKAGCVPIRARCDDRLRCLPQFGKSENGNEALKIARTNQNFFGDKGQLRALETADCSTSEENEFLVGKTGVEFAIEKDIDRGTTGTDQDVSMNMQIAKGLSQFQVGKKGDGVMINREREYSEFSANCVSVDDGGMHQAVRGVEELHPGNFEQGVKIAGDTEDRDPLVFDGPENGQNPDIYLPPAPTSSSLKDSSCFPSCSSSFFLTLFPR